MATDGLSSLLAVVIPLGLILFIGIKIYNKMSVDNPSWFSNFREWIGEKTTPKSEKIDPMHGGSINYT